MRVRVTRSGGIAGISRRGDLECPEDSELWYLATTALREIEESEGEAAASSSKNETTHQPPARHMRDAYQWHVVIDDQDFEFSDAELPQSMRTLAVEVLKHPPNRQDFWSDLEH